MTKEKRLMRELRRQLSCLNAISRVCETPGESKECLESSIEDIKLFIDREKQELSRLLNKIEKNKYVQC